MIEEVKSARSLTGYKVELEYDGLHGVIDLESELYGPLFGQLRDINEFRKVRFDPELRTIVWPMRLT